MYPQFVSGVKPRVPVKKKKAPIASPMTGDGGFLHGCRICVNMLKARPALQVSKSTASASSEVQ
jgi:hypothetical protein